MSAPGHVITCAPDAAQFAKIVRKSRTAVDVRKKKQEVREIFNKYPVILVTAHYVSFISEISMYFSDSLKTCNTPENKKFICYEL